MFMPNQLAKVNSGNSLQLARLLSSSKKKLTAAMAKSIASNIPANTPLDSIASICKYIIIIIFSRKEKKYSILNEYDY